MRRKSTLTFVTVGLATFLGSCVGDYRSSWKDLEDMEALSCESWPRAENEVQVSDVRYLPGKAPGFLVTVLMNNARETYYFIPFSGSITLDPKLRQPMLFNKNMQIAGQGLLEGAPAIVLLTEDEKGKPLIESRQLMQNTVLNRTDLGGSTFSSGNSMIVRNRLWLSLYNGEYRLATAGMEKAEGKPSFIKETFSTEPKLLGEHEGRFWAMLMEQKKDQANFALVAHDQKKTQRLSLPVESLKNAEGWDAEIGTDGFLYLSYVKGDSLVGQAHIVVEKFDIQNAPSLIKHWETSLGDAHVSDPVVSFKNGGLQVFSARWLDGESLLSVYEIEGDGLKESRFGPLPDAASISEVIFGEENTFVLTRYKQSDSDLLSYRLCSY